MSLCVLGSHECIHRLIVGFRGWEIAVLGKKKKNTGKTDQAKSNLTEEEMEGLLHAVLSPSLWQQTEDLSCVVTLGLWLAA